MKVKVLSTDQSGRVNNEFVPIVSEPHNIQFDHAESNMLFFRILRSPQKKLLSAIMGEEGKEAMISGVFVRASFGIQGVCLVCIVRYTIKDQVKKNGGGVLNCYTITEKERLFSMKYSDAEAVRLVEPFLLELDASNSKKDSALLKEWFQEWAHPLTLESVTETLTEDQKLKAAKMLKAFFAA